MHIYIANLRKHLCKQFYLLALTSHQLLLNPSKQRASNVAGLEYISNLLSRCTLYENAYCQRYEEITVSRPLDDAEHALAENHKYETKRLYTLVLMFQAQTIRRLSQNTWIGTTRDAFLRDDWNEMLQGIKDQEIICQKLFDTVKHEVSIESRDKKQEQRVRSLLEKLDDIKDTISGLHRGDEETKCFETLRTSDYRAAKDRNPQRLPGTCRWFLEHPKYQEWTAQPPISRLLWVSADPGCGKSVLARTLVDQYDLGSVCYYFFKNETPTSRSAIHALCALLHQLCSARPAMMRHVLLAYKRNGAKLITLFEELWLAFESIIQDSTTKKVICILDALDECSDAPKEPGSSSRLEAEERKLLLQKLAGIATTSASVKVLLTSRPYTSIETALFYKTGLDKNHVHLTGADRTEKALIEEEIGLVIKTKVVDFRERRSAEGIDDCAYAKLQKHLDGAKNRTYLWVSAIFAKLETLVDAPEWELMQVIETLPEDVDKAYENILTQTPRDKRKFLERVLHIMLAALRPLSLEEMSLACSYAGESTQRLPEAAFRKWIRNLCGFFIDVVEIRGSNELQFVHETAREYLLSLDFREGTGWRGSFKQPESHAVMAEICLASLFVLPKEPCTKPTKFDIYAALYWVSHFNRAKFSQTLQDRAKDFMLHNGEMAPSFERWIDRLDSDYDLKHNFNRKAFNAENFIGAARHIISKPPTPLFLASIYGWIWIIEDLSSSSAAPFQWDQMNSCGYTSLAVAAQFGQLMVVEYLLSKGVPIDLCDTESYGKVPLVAAAEAGHSAIVRMLLANRADIEGGSSGTMPLEAAARKGHLEIVQILLTSGAFVNAESIPDVWLNQTAFYAAVKEGHPDIVRELIAAHADVNMTSKYSQKPLILAVEEGNLQMVKDLLAAGANVNTTSQFGATALHMAVRAKALDIVEILVAAGADANAADRNCHTILQTAAAEGSAQIVERLLAVGVDVNAVPAESDGLTALQAAAREGHITIVESLLAAGADVNAAPARINGQTALWAATEGGKADIVERLLAVGADVNAISDQQYCQTALQAAANKESSTIVEMLLAAKADVNAAPAHDEGRTALQSAAGRSSSVIVNQLLAAGADVDAAPTDFGYMALEIAVRRCDAITVEELLAAGANVNLAIRRIN